MILNNTKLRLLAVMVVLSVSLSGCSSMPTFPVFSSGEDEKTQTNETSPSVTVQSEEGGVESEGLEGATPPVPLTAEELEEQALAAKARALMGTMNAFKLDKEKLNS